MNINYTISSRKMMMMTQPFQRIIACGVTLIHVYGCSDTNFEGNAAGKNLNQLDTSPPSAETKTEFENAQPNPQVTVIDKGQFETFGQGCHRATSKNVTITFPPESRVCEWPGGMKNYRISGYRKQVEIFDLPTGAVICSANLRSTTPQIKYDDHLFFSINGFLVASSNFTFNELVKHYGMDVEHNIIKMDINQMMYKTFSRSKNSAQNAYCVDGATCNIPKTQSTGHLELNISNSFFENILNIQTQANQQPAISLTITGDDDRSDCQHTGVSLHGEVTYYIPRL